MQLAFSKSLRFILSIFFFISFISSVSVAEEYFEGTINFRMSQAGRQMSMKYMAQGLKMRTEVSAGPVGTSIGLADYSKGKIYVLMPQLKRYMEMDFNAQAVGKQANDLAKNAKIEETNEEEVIAGYKCTRWISQQDGKTSDIWVAKGIGKFFEPKNDNDQSPAEAWKEKLAKEGGFPFRVIQKGADGKEIYRLEVEKVDKSPLDSSLFSVPDGYQKFAVPK